MSLLRMARALTHPKPTRSVRKGEDAKVRRSPQAVACRKRCVEELGRPRGLLTAGRSSYGMRLMRHGRGNPETELCRNLSDETGKRSREAEEYCERESLPHADGESYQA
jgi:hypothetical protein